MIRLDIGAISITDDGSGDYELVSFGPGTVERENTLAESRWIDGGSLVSSRRRIATMNLVVRVTGSSLSEAETNTEALVAALDNDGTAFSMTEWTASTSTVWSCLPATVTVARDPIMMTADSYMVTASIPRQPVGTAGGS